VRHGNGIFITSEGHKFEGQWVNDVKHGVGILTYKDGEKIEGYWNNDRINGVAKVTARGSEPIHCIYKDDMMIETTNTGISTSDKVYTVFSILMFFIFYGAIPLALITENKALFGLMGVYFVYIIWSCCHSATKYTTGLMTIKDLFV